MILRASRNRFLTLTRQIGAGGALLSALTFPLAGCDDGSETKPPLIQEDSIGLAAFPGCDPLLDYLQDEAITLIDTFGGVGVQYDDVTALGGEPARADNEGGAGGEQSPADPSFSGTNVQEAGVDEPDRVKTDGRFLYLVRDGWFLIYDAADLTLVSQTAVIDGWEGTLLVEGDTALVLGHTWGAPEEAFADADADRLARGTKAVISVYDLNDRAAPRLVRRSYLEGEILSARLVAGTARVVVRAELARGIDVDAVAGEIRGGGGSAGAPPRATTPAEGDASGGDEGAGGGIDPESGAEEVPVDEMPQSQTVEDWRAAAQAFIESTTIEQWLPLAYDAVGEDRRVAPIVACGQFHRPGERSGLGAIAVVSVDMAAPTVHRADPAVITAGGVVYANDEALYVTSPNHALLMAVVGGGDVAVGVATEGGAGGEATSAADEGPTDEAQMGLRLADDEREATQIHRFAIGDAGAPAAYRDSGRVFGRPLNQFSLSEYQGTLRIATTEDQYGADEFRTVNHLFTLQPRQDADGAPSLDVIGQVTDLAPDERIYATRFLGERGFVVTFRQVDPLFTLDLSDPSAPALVGELEVPGFSTYLHPFDADHLIGIGQSATDEGRITGMQLSLFDVSDFAHPALAHQALLGEGWSDALYDHHAFTFWAPESLLMIPVNGYDEVAQTEHAGLQVFRVGLADGFTSDGIIEHADLGDAQWQAQVERSLVIGDAIYSISAAGIKANGIDDLAERARAVFPEARVDDRDGGVDPGRPIPVEDEPQPVDEEDMPPPDEAT